MQAGTTSPRKWNFWRSLILAIGADSEKHENRIFALSRTEFASKT